MSFHPSLRPHTVSFWNDWNDDWTIYARAIPRLASTRDPCYMFRSDWLIDFFFFFTEFQDGRLLSGDHILQIGDVSLRGMGSEQVAAVLRQSGTQVRLIVARPIEPTSPDYQVFIQRKQCPTPKVPKVNKEGFFFWGLLSESFSIGSTEWKGTF